jgi:hypothetical protein
VAARTLAGGRRESLASTVGTGLAPAKCFTTDPVCNRARNHPETGRVHRIPSTDEDVLCSPPPSRSARPFRSPASRSSQVLRFWSRRGTLQSG